MTMPDDSQLKALLAEWKAPPVPPSLEAAIRAEAHPGLWRRWLSAEIRIPAPIGVAGLAGVLVLLFALAGGPAASPGSDGLDVRDFQPVENLNPRIIRSSHEND